MNKAIKLAIEKGGYKGNYPGDGKTYLAPLRRFGVVTALKMFEAYIAQDPLFWQALGKALGWLQTQKRFRCKEHPKLDFITIKFCGECGKEMQEFDYDWMEWKNYAHKYFDLILTGGDVDTFWKDLIK